MTKKHFTAIAKSFKTNFEATKTTKNHVAIIAVEGTIHAFCHVAAQFNPNFDRARFLKACGI